VRIVIDTNVLISATFWTGNPKQLLNRVRKKEFVLLTSQILLNELKEILIRPDKPFKLSEEEAEHVVNRIRSLAELVRTHSFVKICRDEQDNRVLECAIDGGADWIISGDAHLLELQSFQGVRIGTVGDFLSCIGQQA
jgi:putative PIN family toxin of toxin-antitoxin system